MTASVIYTRNRGDGEGGGFEYLTATWAELEPTWASRVEPHATLAPAVLIDVSERSADESADDERAVRTIVGGDVLVRTFDAEVSTFGGNKHAYWAAIQLALEQSADDLLILEDDLSFCGNGFLRMLTFPIPVDLDWVSFFGPHILLHGRAWAGLWRTPAPSFGTLAIKFRRAPLQKILAWSRSSPDFGRFKVNDQALDLCRKDLGLRWALHVPELVEHTGVKSTQGDSMSDNRRAQSWPGPRFDALSLYSRHDLFL